MPTERSPIARYEGEHQGVRAWDHPIADVRGSTIEGQRGELRLSSPIGYAWDRHVGLGLGPDRRLQEVIRLVFQKFRELGSARQVLLWMAFAKHPFSLSVERPDVDIVRMAANPIS